VSRRCFCNLIKIYYFSIVRGYFDWDSKDLEDGEEDGKDGLEGWIWLVGGVYGGVYGVGVGIGIGVELDNGDLFCFCGGLFVVSWPSPLCRIIVISLSFQLQYIWSPPFVLYLFSSRSAPSLNSEMNFISARISNVSGRKKGE